MYVPAGCLKRVPASVNALTVTEHAVEPVTALDVGLSVQPYLTPDAGAPMVMAAPLTVIL